MIETIGVMFVFLLLIIAMISDTKAYKIYNKLCVIGSVFGLILNGGSNGGTGLLNSLAGLFLPIGLLFIFFALGGLGAGDIKLFAAIGAIVGPRLILEIILISFIFNSMIAIILLIKSKTFLMRMKYLISYVNTLIYSKQIKPYYDLKTNGYTHVMRLTYGISLGFLTTILRRYF